MKAYVDRHWMHRANAVDFIVYGDGTVDLTDPATGVVVYSKTAGLTTVRSAVRWARHWGIAVHTYIAAPTIVT